MNLTTEIVREEFEARIQRWPLYQEGDIIQIIHREYEDGDCWHILYATGNGIAPEFRRVAGFVPETDNILCLHVNADEAYIAYIGVCKNKRGLGHGEALYKLCEEFTWALGVPKIRQVPSGGYGPRKRENYLADRGWLPGGMYMYKLNPNVSQGEDVVRQREAV